MGIILDVLIIAVSLISIAVGVACAARRGLFATLLHIGGICISAVGAALLTGPLVKVLNGMFSGVIGKALANETGETIMANTTLKAAINGAPGALLAPFVFALIFFVLKIINDIIIFAVVKGERAKIIDFKGSKAVAALIGAGVASACLWVFHMPVAGTVRTTSGLLEWGTSKIEMFGDRSSMPKIVDSAIDFASTAGKSFMVKFYDETLKTGVVYDRLASVNVNGKTVSLPKELKALTNMADTVLALVPSSDGSGADSGENPGGDQNGKSETVSNKDISDAFRTLSDQIGETEIGSMAIKEEVDKAVDSWKKGDEYMGITVITGNEAVDELMTELMDCIEKTDSEDLGDVLDFMADVVDVLPDVGGSSSQSGETDPGEQTDPGQQGDPGQQSGIDDKDIISGIDIEGAIDLIGKAFDNDSMNPFAEALIKWLLRRAANALEVDAEAEIERISLAKAQRSDVQNLQDLLKEMAHTALEAGFQDKLKNNEALNGEEKQFLKDSLEKLKTDKIVGEAVTKISTAAEEYLD